MKPAFQKQAWLVAVALVMPFACSPLGSAESTESRHATQVALRSRSQPLDSSWPPARGTVTLTEQSPQSVAKLDSGAVLIDFGQVAFGNVELTPPADFEGVVRVRFGEKLADGAIDRTPPGTVRYSEVEVHVTPGSTTIIAPSADERNTQQSGKVTPHGDRTPPAVVTPPEWGVVAPFRWVEIEGAPGSLRAEHIVRRAAFPKHWDEDSAAFECSNETLNRVWELCRYSIKATLFAGIYVDGDRERIPYEADAYLNQLSHYYVDGDGKAARKTFDWLMQHPTWPTEWAPHMVFMAHADWMHNGDADWISQRYESLKSKTLLERCNESGLVISDQKQMRREDIVDWPPSERDGFVRTEVNAVVNAFHLAAVDRMAILAEVAGVTADSIRYKRHAARAKQAFYSQLFDAEAGLFRDGPSVEHHALHANFYPLAFGIAQQRDRQGIVEWLVERGMRCSVYGAQYYLESLFENGAGEAAVKLIVAPGERSWRHMLESDATITWEAWNEAVKPNLDWNHAWGAAPANLLPRFVLGVQPLAPGWSRARICPRPSGLDFARGIVPTPLGPISVDWSRNDNFRLELELPAGMAASVRVPTTPHATGVFVNGEPVAAVARDGYWVLAEDVAGKSVIEVR